MRRHQQGVGTSVVGLFPRPALARPGIRVPPAFHKNCGRCGSPPFSGIARIAGLRTEPTVIWTAGAPGFSPVGQRRFARRGRRCFAGVSRPLRRLEWSARCCPGARVRPAPRRCAFAVRAMPGARRTTWGARRRPVNVIRMAARAARDQVTSSSVVGVSSSPGVSMSDSLIWTPGLLASSSPSGVSAGGVSGVSSPSSRLGCTSVPSSSSPES